MLASRKSEEIRRFCNVVIICNWPSVCEKDQWMSSITTERSIHIISQHYNYNITTHIILHYKLITRRMQGIVG